MRFDVLKKFLILLVLPVLSCTSSVNDELIKGSRVVTSQTRTLGVNDLQSIELNSAYRASFSTRLDTAVIFVIADDNLFPYVETNISNGAISIGEKDGYAIRTSNDINIDVKSHSLKNVVVNGSGELYVDALSGVDPHFTVNGSGIVTVTNFKSSLASGFINGNGLIQLGSEISTSKIAALNITIVGDGKVKIFTIVDKLNVSIIGSGVVNYKGNPAITKSISGSGEVVKF